MRVQLHFQKMKMKKKVLQIARCDDDFVQPTVSLTTQNVYGFADFTTTIGNTVMIFSPSSIVANPGDLTFPPHRSLVHESYRAT